MRTVWSSWEKRLICDKSNGIQFFGAIFLYIGKQSCRIYLFDVSVSPFNAQELVVVIVPGDVFDIMQQKVT